MKIRLYFFGIACILLSVSAQAQYGSDLGAISISKLRWKDIKTNGQTIGLTTDNKIYVWGANYYFSIHTESGFAGLPLRQTTPYYVPSPAGEKVIKVDVGIPNRFGCLTESGKLYGWGVNEGSFSNTVTGWSPTASPSATDKTVARRTPQQITISGENQFVDFAFEGYFWVAIGASGKAYFTGADGTSLTPNWSFIALPIPAGANSATFKYVKVWCGMDDYPKIYLKGNDGKIYYTGRRGNGLSMGVPAYFSIYNSTTGSTSFPDAGGTPPTLQMNVRTDIPQLVPFPDGEDIIKMVASGSSEALMAETAFALSASGKAFGCGFWGIGTINSELFNYSGFRRYFTYPLASTPVLGTQLAKPIYSNDTMYVLKRFVEIAKPAGASKIIDIDDYGSSVVTDDRYYRETVIVTDENKAYWAGSRRTTSEDQNYLFPNYLQYAAPNISDYCEKIGVLPTTSPTSWSVELINYRGVADISFRNNGQPQSFFSRFIISNSGMGYFEGLMGEHSGLGKNRTYGPDLFAMFPTPIANEQLDNCNPSPGVAGGGTAGSSLGIGAIDCSKTKLSPAPVAGVPSQINLQVSINVTTAGSFSPLSVSGSGMSPGNGITSVSTTTTGVQTFSIPVNYDGSTLTNGFQFTIGQGGSCTADLTTKPNNEITKVWSLTNCSAITPGTLSK